MESVSGRIAAGAVSEEMKIKIKEESLLTKSQGVFKGFYEKREIRQKGMTKTRSRLRFHWHTTIRRCI